MLSRLITFAVIASVCLAYGDTPRDAELELLRHWYRAHPHKKLAAQRTPREWRSGAVWRFVTTVLPGKPQPPVITLRVTEEAATSCSHDVEWKNVWRKLTVVDGKRPLPPIYQVEGRALQIGLTEEICDSYDDIDGVLTNGEFKGIRIASGLGAGTEVIGTVRGSRVQR